MAHDVCLEEDLKCDVEGQGPQEGWKGQEMEGKKKEGG